MTAEELKALMAEAINDSIAPLRAEVQALKDSAEEKKDDEKKDDADEKKDETEEKKENDSAAAVAPVVESAPVTNDAEIEELKAKIAALEAAAAPAEPRSEDEEAAIVDAQAHADSVYALHGARAPKPMERETLLAYRKRLAKGLQKHSESQKNVSIAAINDSQYLAYVEREIFADAAKAAGSTQITRVARVAERNVNGIKYNQLEV